MTLRSEKTQLKPFCDGVTDDSAWLADKFADAETIQLMEIPALEVAWGVLWRTGDKNLSGPREHLVGRFGCPSASSAPAGLAGYTTLAFRTREECRAFIQEKYGYIRHRKDLREYPHGWLMPQAVKIAISVAALTATKTGQAVSSGGAG